MQIGDKYYTQKKEFVDELGKLLTMAKPHLVKCEFKLGEELPTEKRYVTRELKSGSVAYTPIDWQPDGEWVVITCENGYQYKINVTANSLAAVAEAVFCAMVCK